ncbi:MAG TPA: uroporphyrinogen decarboxylase [Rhizomicrobium sp.]|nr:uroporphyrinogen decarboxylase [Rhizomicrobium sp.]
MKKTLLRVLEGEAVWPPPIWMMRQAGRYLPEYRALRGQAGSFWTMCMDPAMAAEITMQPIRRFGFDAAIIFSDILTVPFALGCEIAFDEGVGPSLSPVESTRGLTADPGVWLEKLAPACRTLERVRTALPEGTTLLGFAGAPWTLATYMAAGRGGDEQRAAKLWAYRDPDGFGALLDLLGDCVAAHLTAQLEAGADAVQIFDSWAGGIPAEAFARWVVAPTRRIVDKVRARNPGARIIGFPRAATLEGYAQYAAATAVDAVSIDTSAPIAWAGSALAERTAVQGNLDPVALVAGGTALDAAVDRIVDGMRGRRFIFNLGHGVLPQTPVENVADVIRRVRAA